MDITGEISLSVPVKELPEPNKTALAELLNISYYTAMDYDEVDWEEDWEDIKDDISSWIKSLYCPYYGEENDSDSMDVEIESNKISIDASELYWDEEDDWPYIYDFKDAAEEITSVFGDIIEGCNIEFVGNDFCFRHILKDGHIEIEHGRIEKVCKYTEVTSL